MLDVILQAGAAAGGIRATLEGAQLTANRFPDQAQYIMSPTPDALMKAATSMGISVRVHAHDANLVRVLPEPGARERLAHERPEPGVWLVWDPLNGERAEADRIAASDAGDAAELYAERDVDGWTDGMYHRGPHPIHVAAPGKPEQIFEVSAELHPVFHAARAEKENTDV